MHFQGHHIKLSMCVLKLSKLFMWIRLKTFKERASYHTVAEKQKMGNNVGCFACVCVYLRMSLYVCVYYQTGSEQLHQFY